MRGSLNHPSVNEGDHPSRESRPRTEDARLNHPSVNEGDHAQACSHSPVVNGRLNHPSVNEGDYVGAWRAESENSPCLNHPSVNEGDHKPGPKQRSKLSKNRSSPESHSPYCTCPPRSTVQVICTAQPPKKFDDRHPSVNEGDHPSRESRPRTEDARLNHPSVNEGDH